MIPDWYKNDEEINCMTYQRSMFMYPTKDISIEKVLVR